MPTRGITSRSTGVADDAESDIENPFRQPGYLKRYPSIHTASLPRVIAAGTRQLMVARMWAPLVSAVLTKNHSTAAQRQRWNLRMPQIKSLNARMTGHSTTTRRITIGCRPSGSYRVIRTHRFSPATG